MKTTGNTYDYVFYGKIPIKNQKGKFTIRNFDKLLGDNFHITLYTIDGYGAVNLEKREKNSFYVVCTERDVSSAGYQIIGFSQGIDKH